MKKSTLPIILGVVVIAAVAFIVVRRIDNTNVRVDDSVIINDEFQSEIILADEVEEEKVGIASLVSDRQYAAIMAMNEYIMSGKYVEVAIKDTGFNMEETLGDDYRIYTSFYDIYNELLADRIGTGRDIKDIEYVINVIIIAFEMQMEQRSIMYCQSRIDANPYVWPDADPPLNREMIKDYEALWQEMTELIVSEDVDAIISYYYSNKWVNVTEDYSQYLFDLKDILMEYYE